MIQDDSAKGHPASGACSSLSVHIERLVIDGVALTGAQGAQLGKAVESELSRLLAQGGVSPHFLSGGAWPQLQVEAIQAGGDCNPSRFGIQVARTLYAGLNNWDAT